MITLQLDTEQLDYIIDAVERDIEDLDDQGLGVDLKIATAVLGVLLKAEREQAIPF